VCGVLEQAAKSGINIDMIVQSPAPATSDKISFGFTFGDGDVQKLLAITSKQENSGTAPMVNCGNVKITVQSQEMIAGVGFASKVFAVLKSLDCLPLLVTTGIDEISLLVHESCKSDLERELRTVFG